MQVQAIDTVPIQSQPFKERIAVLVSRPEDDFVNVFNLRAILEEYSLVFG